MPASTTTASAAVTVSTWASRRCSPATPTSSSRSGAKPWARKRQQALVGDGAVGGPGGDDEDGGGADRRRLAVEQAPAELRSPGRARPRRPWSGRRRRGSAAPAPVPWSSSSPTMRTHCSGVLPGPYTASGMPWRRRPVVVDEGVADVGERQPPQPAHDVVGVDPAGGQFVEQRPQRRFVHRPMLPETSADPARRPIAAGAIGLVAGAIDCTPSTSRPSRRRPGEGRVLRAVRHVHRAGAAHRSPTSPTLELVAFPTVPDVLDAVAGGEVDCGVVPIENSIEGVVNFTQDALAFDYDLLITREIVLDIELCLVGLPGPAPGGRQGRAVDPRRHGAVPPVPARADCRRPRCGPPTARPRRPGSWPRAAARARWPSRPAVAAGPLRPRRPGQ